MIKSLQFDKYEIGILTNALVHFRNMLIEEKRTTDAVDDLLIKIVETPVKKNTSLKTTTKGK